MLVLGVTCISALHTASGADAALSADARIASALKEISSSRIQASVEKLVSFQTRSTLSTQDALSVAEGKGIGAARDWIKSEFERYSQACGGCLQVRTDSFVEAAGERIPQPTPTTNVYAVLQGTSPESAKHIFVVTGHYDSRNSDTLDTRGAAPGANDDASGTAVSLECARVLSKLKFPSTIIFLAVAGEEQGLNGSRHFAQMAKSAGWDVQAVLNNDIVGGDRSAGQDATAVRIFSEGIPSAKPEDFPLSGIRAAGYESDSTSRELARYISEVARAYRTEVTPMLVFRPDRYLRGGDHTSFNAQGFAAVRFTEYRENFDHQHQDVRNREGREYGDLPKFVDYDYMAKVSRLNAATLAALAAAPGPPRNVRLLAKDLENDSMLTWEASSDPQASYEVLWRNTTSPEWEHRQSSGNQTRITLPLSKDNVLFAVCALDAQGHRSLPVVPSPER